MVNLPKISGNKTELCQVDKRCEMSFELLDLEMEKNK